VLLTPRARLPSDRPPYATKPETLQERYVIVPQILAAVKE
jgi:hypothetical protein